MEGILVLIAIGVVGVILYRGTTGKGRRRNGGGGGGSLGADDGPRGPSHSKREEGWFAGEGGDGGGSGGGDGGGGGD